MQSYQDTEVSFAKELTQGEQGVSEPLFNDNILDEYYGGVEYPGAVEIFIECAGRMLESLSLRLEKLSTSVREEKYDDIIYYAHQLQGSFNATGSPLLAKHCEILGTDARAKNAQNCHKRIDEILRLSQKFSVELQSFIAKLN